MDAWAERMRPWLWREAIAAAGIDLDAILHQPYAEDATLPWDTCRRRMRRRRGLMEHEATMAEDEQ